MKTRKSVLALQFYNETVHEDPLLDKGWIAITDFMCVKKIIKSLILLIKR
jgi:hypothetical protein